MGVTKVGIVGFGKIAYDQHVPSIAGNPAFRLAAIASQRGLTVDGVPSFRTADEMIAGVPDLDAVAVCTPPQVRHTVARAMLAAGKHVMLEKPPTATLSELQDLADFAERQKRVLFTTWHSQYNAAVAAARAALAGKAVIRLAITWREDVRRWHPGQKWIWAAGGFGVFDPGINALSIVSLIVPEPIFVERAALTFPANCDAPIAASLVFRNGRAGAVLTAELDWRQNDKDLWEIVVETADGLNVTLENGGGRLLIDGALKIDEKHTEYEQIYARFAELLAANTSGVDAAPLRLVADAFLVGRRVIVEPFIE